MDNLKHILEPYRSKLIQIEDLLSLYSKNKTSNAFIKDMVFYLEKDWREVYEKGYCREISLRLNINFILDKKLFHPKKFNGFIVGINNKNGFFGHEENVLKFIQNHISSIIKEETVTCFCDTCKKNSSFSYYSLSIEEKNKDKHYSNQEPIQHLNTWKAIIGDGYDNFSNKIFIEVCHKCMEWCVFEDTDF